MIEDIKIRIELIRCFSQGKKDNPELANAYETLAQICLDQIELLLLNHIESLLKLP
jgi:hypothetical protein